MKPKEYTGSRVYLDVQAMFSYSIARLWLKSEAKMGHRAL